MNKKALIFLTLAAIAGLAFNGIVMTQSTAQDSRQQQEEDALMTKDTKNLTPMQEYVTQHGGTEKPFENAYWDNHEEGIYVDVISGDPLFSSLDKFDSGTGWPSFTKPISEEALSEHPDHKMFIPRTEVRSSNADSHLGHVFTDGPADKGGLRYCINSASLRFIPKDKLEEEGYGQYSGLFEFVENAQE